MCRSSGRAAGALDVTAGALGILLLFDGLRVFLPSLITILGDAGSTPPGQLGGFALAWFATGLVAAVIGRFTGPTVIRIVGAVALGGGRLALAFTDGGQPQLYLAALTVAGGLAYLTAGALAGTGRRAPIAVTAGLAASTTLHAALGTTDLTWRTGVLPVGAQAVLVLAFLATEFPLRTRYPVDSGPAAPARYWGAIGPAVLLAGVVTGATARGGATELPGPLGVGLVAGAGVLAVLFAAAPRLTGTPWLPAIALPLLVVATSPTVSAGGIAGVSAWYVPVAAALAAIALGACLGWSAATAAPPAPAPAPAPAPDTIRPGTDPARAGVGWWGHGVAAGGGLLGCGALVFGYYAAYDADLGFPNGLLLVVAALWVTVAAAPWRRRGAGRSVTVRWAAVAVVVALLAGGGAALAVPRVGGSAPATASIRLVTYNIRMAYDLRGRFSVDRLAAAIAGQRPDVVLLNEVDRGWLLNGGHDDLAMLAARLHMPYWFAPAADPLWGDAVLTRLPVRTVESVPLPAEGPTGAEALGVTLGLPGGGRLGVVATHFQPDGDRPALSQARAAAGLVRRLGGPVVLAGDLNSRPGSPAIGVLRDAGLTIDHHVASYPANRPVKPIDHILTTGDVTGADLVAVRTTASDHVPVAITLEVR